MEHQCPVQRADEPTAGLTRSGDLTQPASSTGLPKRLRWPEKDIIPHENDKVVAKSLFFLLQGGHGDCISEAGLLTIYCSQFPLWFPVSKTLHGLDALQLHTAPKSFAEASYLIFLGMALFDTSMRFLERPTKGQNLIFAWFGRNCIELHVETRSVVSPRHRG